MVNLSERFEMRLGEDILARVDSWRSAQYDVPSRAEAMRRLVELGLMRAASDTVKFSDGEKLLTMMMRDVYKHFKIQGEIDSEFVSDVIHGGHYWAPKWDMSGLYHDYEDSPADVSFVGDVLDMWSFIEEAYEKLSVEDKEYIKKEVGPLGEHVQFIGFDGNNETSNMGIARFLIEKMNRFTRFKGRGLNSHSPTKGRYKQMLVEFLPMRAGLVGRGLSANQIVQIMKR